MWVLRHGDHTRVQLSCPGQRTAGGSSIVPHSHLQLGASLLLRDRLQLNAESVTSIGPTARSTTVVSEAKDGE